MKLNNFSALTLFFLIFAVSGKITVAQTYPAKLLNEVPAAAQVLDSPNVLERASILSKLVVAEPSSCTNEQNLPFNLTKEDYEFVVSKILELDLSALDYKKDADIWGKLQFLIVRFEMSRQLESYVKYLAYPDRNVQAEIINSVKVLKARKFAAEIARFLDSEDKYLRDETLRTLIELKSDLAVPSLIKTLESPDFNQRYYALKSLAEVNGTEAAPNIAQLLNDEHADNRYWAIDALVKINAKSQAGKVWKFFETETNPRFAGFALAALLQFDEKKAVPVFLKILKDAVKNGNENPSLEFIDKVKPKILINELIALYHQKERFFAADDDERKMRLNIYNLLYNYRTREAIAIYRENLFGVKAWGENGIFQEGNAQILLELNAVEAVDDLIAALSELRKNKNTSYYGTRVGIIAQYLAKFGNGKANKLLIEIAPECDAQYRGAIIAELNRQLNPELWKKISAEKLPSIGIESIAGFSEKAAEKSDVKIEFEKEESSEKVSCLSDDITLKNAVPCAYSDGRMSILESLSYMFSDRRNQKYTWIFDNGKIRVLSIEKAIDWWRKNQLSN